jgi:hypothetical protein
MDPIVAFTRGSRSYGTGQVEQSPEDGKNGGKWSGYLGAIKPFLTDRLRRGFLKKQIQIQVYPALNWLLEFFSMPVVSFS